MDHAVVAYSQGGLGGSWSARVRRGRPRNVGALLSRLYTAARHLSRFADSAPLGGVPETEPERLAEELETVARILREIEFED